jgi:hypothetical protein
MQELITILFLIVVYFLFLFQIKNITALTFVFLAIKAINKAFSLIT